MMDKHIVVKVLMISCVLIKINKELNKTFKVNSNWKLIAGQIFGSNDFNQALLEAFWN